MEPTPGGSCAVTEKSDDNTESKYHLIARSNLQPRSAGEILQRRLALEVQPEGISWSRAQADVSALAEPSPSRPRSWIQLLLVPSIAEAEECAGRRGIELLDRHGITLGRAHADFGVLPRVRRVGGSRNRGETKEGAGLEDLADERTLIRGTVVEHHRQPRLPRRIENASSNHQHAALRASADPAFDRRAGKPAMVRGRHSRRFGRQRPAFSDVPADYHYYLKLLVSPIHSGTVVDSLDILILRLQTWPDMPCSCLLLTRPAFSLVLTNLLCHLLRTILCAGCPARVVADDSIVP